MQHIGIRLENENGGVLEESNLNAASLVDELWKREDYKVQFPIMSGIDPYGDTVFNVHQVSSLLDEIQKLHSNVSDAMLQKLLSNMIQLLSKAEQHDYVRFIGD